MSYTNENFYYEVVLDVETSGLDYKVNELIGVGIYCPSKDIDVYVPAVQYTGDDVYERDELRKEKLINYIHKTFFADPYAVVIFHNAKFDLKFLKVSSFSQLLCRVIDTAILYHIIYPNQEKNLDSVAKHLLNITSKEQYNNSVPARIKNKKWLWPVATLSDYCKNDCRLTYNIYQKLLDEIINNKLLTFAKEQHRYLAALYEIEIAGIRIDQDKLAEEIKSITFLLSLKERELQSLIRSYCPELLDLNYKSSKQLSSLLYEKLGLEKADRDIYPSGKVFDKLFTSTMTNKNLLKKLNHEIPLFVTEVKKLETVLKYYKNYISLSHDGVIHPQFNLTGTVTGRLSCSKPNLQNVGKTINVFGHEYKPRSVFVASPEYNLVSMDYKQQEIRMLAVLSQDEAYLDAMSKGVDMHEAISYAMFPSLTPELRKQKRTLIKNLHFG